MGARVRARGACDLGLEVGANNHCERVHRRDIAGVKAALAAKGITPALDITEVKPLGIKVMYLVDPEGNAVEIAQRL